MRYRLIPLLFLLTGLAVAQQQPTVTIGVNSNPPTTGTCNDSSQVGNVYIVRADPATAFSGPYMCLQTGPFAAETTKFGWIPLGQNNGSPGGPAGGVLSGTYPNPGFAVPTLVNPMTAAGQCIVGAASGNPTQVICINLQAFVNVHATGYVPARFSTQINNSASNVSTTSGSPIITCSSGCNWTTADVGDAIVVLTEGTADVFQSTIISRQSGTQVTLADNADVTATGRFAYMGTDSTAGIDAAFTAAKAANACLFIPAGGYFYNGSGLSGWNSPCITGEGKNSSYIFIGAGKYFVDGSEFWFSSQIEKVGYIGGAAAIRNRFTGNNVSAPQDINNNYFRDYSTSAISFNSSDITYLHIRYNHFIAQNSISTFGVAIAGPDESEIQFNSFYRDQFHIKCGLGCSALRITSNDLIQSNTGVVRRAGVWIVPSTQTTVVSPVISLNKFGNENISSQDVRVLLADTAASGGGSFFGDTQPLTTASTGYVTNLDFETSNTVIGGSSGGVQPIFYSYTPNIRDCKISAMIEENNPGYVIQFDGVVTQINDPHTLDNVFGPFPGYAFTQGNTTPMLLTNSAGWGRVFDTTGYLNGSNLEVQDPFGAGASPAGFASLLTTPINSFTVFAGTIAPITDAAGGSDAVTLTSNGGGSALIYTTLGTVPTVGIPVWVEIDFRQGSSGTPATLFDVRLSGTDVNTPIYDHLVNLGSTWKRYRFSYTSRVALTPFYIRLLQANFTASVTVDIGRVRVYQAMDPVGGGQFTDLYLPASAGAAPTVNGEARFDTTHKATMLGGNGGITGSVPRLVYWAHPASDIICAHAGDTSIVTFSYGATACNNLVTDGNSLTTFASQVTIPASFMVQDKMLRVRAEIGVWGSTTAPSISAYRFLWGATTLFNNNAVLTNPASTTNRGFITDCMVTANAAPSASSRMTMDCQAPTISGSGMLNATAPALAATNSSQVLTFAIAYTATGIASGTYTSGITATGTVGQTCALTAFNNGNSGGTATVALTGTNTIAGGTALVITNTGMASTSAATSSTAGNGTATCSGTAVVATTLGGAQGNALQLRSLIVEELN